MLPEEQTMQMPMQGDMMQPQMPMGEVSQMEMQEAQEGLIQILQVIETLIQQGLTEDEIIALLAQYGITEAELEQAKNKLNQAEDKKDNPEKIKAQQTLNKAKAWFQASKSN